ncbi:MAG: hypothetical protein M1829_003079 [Trizodia sp. TS-e1964]|nr:MAG: hypothetical protein M1829_003079 [Trizodia sp. TS-e1964]
MPLLPRDSSNTCTIPNFSRCPDLNLPPNFCCPSSNTCISLVNSTAAVCCPAGQTCSYIRPISCDLSAQNSSSHPDATFKSQDLSTPLPTCGDSCCPRGYSCDPNSTICTTVDGSATNSSSTTSSRPSSAASSTPTSLAPSLAPISSSNGTIAAPSSSCSDDPFPAKAVVAGFFPGLLLGAFLAVGISFLISRRQKRSASPDFGSISARVSDPIYNDQGAIRTDFLRRSSPSMRPAPRPPSGVRSLFRKQPISPPIPNPPVMADALGRSHQDITTYSPISPNTTEGGRISRPQTSGSGRRLTRESEVSMESINVFAEESRLRPESHKTTFTDMMETAGFSRNEPFLIEHMRPGEREKGRPEKGRPI